MLASNPDFSPSASPSEENSELLGYVADLQLHMALQSRNLVPTMNSGSVGSTRLELLHEVQAASEKSASRQWL